MISENLVKFLRMKLLRNLLIVLAVLVVGVLLGPKAPTPNLDANIPEISTDLQSLEKDIQTKESAIADIRPDNQARIVWADSAQYQKTPYSVVYLHGFSASQGEGDPVHLNFAKRYGCNLYLARLYEHGLDEAEAMLELSPENLNNSAKEAIAVGRQLGEKVIVMSTSTGGTLALYLASENTDLAGLICYSPNIDIFDPSAQLLVQPWGLQVARLVKGGKYNESKPTSADKPKSPEEEQYWTQKYRLESLVALKALVDETMREETFNKVTSPLLLCYYYKDETEQDHVVSVPRMLEMYEQLGTPENLKRKVAFPNAGAHVIASKYVSKDWENVQAETFKFAEEVLGMQAVETKEN